MDGILERHGGVRMGCQLRCFMLADDIRFAVEGPEEVVGQSTVDITGEAA